MLPLVPTEPSPKRALADLALAHTLGVDLAAFVAQRRAQTPPRSWRRISLDLRDETGVDITYETLRAWFTGSDDEAAA